MDNDSLRPLHQIYSRGAWLWRYSTFESALLPLPDLKGRLIPQRSHKLSRTNCNIKFLRILCASATDCVNCTSGRTTIDLDYHFSQHVDNLVSQTEPSAHKHKDRSREEGRICNLCEASILSAHLSCTRWTRQCDNKHLEVGSLDI